MNIHLAKAASAATGIRRREFLRLAGVAAAAWPVLAHGQQPGQMRHVGVLIGLASNAEDPVAREWVRPFEDAMQAAGWVDGKNVRLDYRFGGDPAKIDASAAELVTLAPDLICAQGLPAARAVHQKTRTIPIVFTLVADPIGFGLVKSEAHPGGNATGFVVWDLSIGGKWIQLLREVAPEITRVGVIYNPETAPYAAPLIASAKAAAGGGLVLIEFPTRNDGDVEAAARSLAREPHGALLIVPEPFTNAHRTQIIAQCARFSLPAVNSVPGAPDQGALLSYTFAFNAMVREPVTYIDRILKGESPGDLPVQAPTKFELSINLKTAKALGILIPESFLLRADRVIE
jgi:putative tryptophan/tyrosine transport system substrate-binding protein